MQRELIPRTDALRLIRALDTLTSQLLEASARTHLLNADGRAPDTPSYAELLVTPPTRRTSPMKSPG